MLLTRYDLLLLDLLTWRVRLATADQLEAFQHLSAVRVRQLLASGFVRSTSMVLSIISPCEPLFRWNPGTNPHSFSALAYQFEKRRGVSPRRKNRIYWATAKAVRLVGGVGGRVRQPLQVEHDLAMTEVFLRRRRLDDETDAQWLGEDCYRLLYRPRGKVPDGVLCNSEGKVVLAIEFGGAYSARRIRQFHRHCDQLRLPYEIW